MHQIAYDLGRHRHNCNPLATALTALAARKQRMITVVIVQGIEGDPQYIRFTDADAAIHAIKLLRKQENVVWAVRGTDYPEGAASVDSFVNTMLAHL